MIEVNIDSSEIKRLADLLEQTPEVIEAAKKEAIAAAASKMKAIVDEEIGGSGKVRRWQGQYIGSLGLYAAVRPRAKTWAEDGRGRPTKYAVGYVTNAINSGHGLPRNEAGFYDRAKWISGKRFYQHASARLGAVAEEAGESVCRAVMSHLSGTKSTPSQFTSPHAGSFQPFTRSIGGKVYTFKAAGS